MSDHPIIAILDCGHWCVVKKSAIVAGKLSEVDKLFSYEGETPCPYDKELKKVCRTYKIEVLLPII